MITCAVTGYGHGNRHEDRPGVVLAHYQPEMAAAMARFPSTEWVRVARRARRAVAAGPHPGRIRAGAATPGAHTTEVRAEVAVARPAPQAARPSKPLAQPLAGVVALERTVGSAA